MATGRIGAADLARGGANTTVYTCPLLITMRLQVLHLQ